MAYVYPQEFSVARARQLGSLVDAAYAQLSASQNHTAWAVPAGYTPVAAHLLLATGG